MRRAIYVAAALLLAALVPSVAQAETAHCKVRSIIASPGAGGIDPSLADLEPQLSRPPFTTWKKFQLLNTNEADLSPGGSSTFPLPGGREGTVTYKGHVDGAGKGRVRLKLQITGASQLSTIFLLDEGGTVLTAGMKHGEAILILGISCTTAP